MSSIAVAPDGTIFVPDRDLNRIRKITPDGIVTNFAGTGETYVAGEDNGNGGPAELARFARPHGVDVGPDGSMYVSELLGDRAVRRIGPDGTITRFAGGGEEILENYVPEGPAVDAWTSLLADVEVGPEGNVFISSTDCLVHKVTPDGWMTVVAGWMKEYDPEGRPGEYAADCGFSGDGGPATDARLGQIEGIDVGNDGTLYIMD
ncbi:MAG: hypothetical protein JJ992_19165, partial [Planctomycetes bacterium]|nr:hypothetical protein [Planctomycetota bacterium]